MKLAFYRPGSYLQSAGQFQRSIFLRKFHRDTGLFEALVKAVQE
jgi:hypothetical protein